jgi:hypothetical protein
MANTPATANDVQRTRALMALLVVSAGDAAIAVTAIFAIVKLGATDTPGVAIATGAFTAISTMTSAYFGIRAASNTAQAVVANQGVQAEPPTISSLSPPAGKVAGGDTVTIHGKGFTGATDLMFGANSAVFRTNSDTQITATTPGSTSAVVVDVIVKTATGSSAAGPSARFTYQ